MKYYQPMPTRAEMARLVLVIETTISNLRALMQPEEIGVLTPIINELEAALAHEQPS